MFGTYRTILAIFVVIGHLGHAPFIGTYSVFGFYILSGYLMTRIMKKSYGYTIPGVFRYLTNRFLRIYPIYWISILFSLILILNVSEESIKTVSPYIYLPINFESILRNISIVFSVHSEPRLTPPSWALTVEIFYYVLIASGISKNKYLTLLWFLASCLYSSYLLIGDASFSYRYFTIPAASLPFSLGALLFYIEPNPLAKKNYLKIIILSILIISNYFISLFFNVLESFGFYINLFLSANIIFTLSHIKTKNKLLKKYDLLIGNLSYPIYLVHYQCGILSLLIFSYLNFDIEKGSNIFVLSSLIICLLLSHLIAIFIENKIEDLRNKVRPPRITP